MTLGENITKYRKQRSLTQEQLAELAGPTVNYLSRVERDRGSRTSARTVHKLAVALNITMDDLMTNSTTKASPVKPYQTLLNNKINSYGKRSEEVSKLLLKILNIN